MKVLCPAHDDENPSMEIYGNFGFCFVCRASIPVTELNIVNREREKAEKTPTDIDSMVKLIKSLPTKPIRGLTLPFDNSGYYIMWPDESYYKKRLFRGKGRYVSPVGIKKPLYKHDDCDPKRTLVIIEGEINAMTAELVMSEKEDIVSPGPATDMLRYLPFYEKYKNINIIVDHDAPGVVFGLELKSRLLGPKRRINLTAMESDFNEVLQEGGEEALRSEYRKALGVSRQSAVR